MNIKVRMLALGNLVNGFTKNATGSQNRAIQATGIKGQAVEVEVNQQLKTSEIHATTINSQAYMRNQLTEGKESQAVEREAKVVNESQATSADDEMMDRELDFSTDGVSVHLGLIADFMYEWEGPVAEQLNLTQSDIAAIKKKHPDDLHLQT